MLDGNKSRRGILFPNGPGCAKSIRTVGMIEDGARGSTELAAAWRITHSGLPQYHAYGGGLKGRLKRLSDSSKTIHIVDELPKSSGAPTVEGEDQPRELRKSGFVEFLFKSRPQFKLPFGK